MSSLLDDGGGRYFNDVFRIKDDEKAKIRLLDGTLAKKFWTHTAKDQSGKFIEVWCVGSKQGCRMCKVNAHPDYANLENRDRPYPSRARFVKPVYVYEHGKVELLVGVEIWQQIDSIHSMFGSVLDHDLLVLRKKKERVIYTVQSAGVTKFDVKIDPAAIPSIDAYFAFLRENEKFAVLLDDGSAPVANKVAPQSLQAAPAGITEKVVEPAPTHTVAVAQTPKPTVQVPNDPKEKVIFEINELFESQYNGELFANCLRQCIREIDPGTGKVKIKIKIDDLDVTELQAFKALYVKGLNQLKETK